MDFTDRSLEIGSCLIISDLERSDRDIRWHAAVDGKVRAGHGDHGIGSSGGAPGSAEIATRDALAFMQTDDMQIFEGDSVAFLISVYRNERLPLRERMAAAMAVSPYERVRLTAVDMRIRDANSRSGWNPGWNDKDAAEELRHAALRGIEVHRQKAHEAMIEKAKAGFALIKQDAFAARAGAFCCLRQLRRHHRDTSRMLLTSSRQ